MSPLGMEMLLNMDVERSGDAESSQLRRQLEISHSAFQELQDMVVELLDPTPPE